MIPAFRELLNAKLRVRLLIVGPDSHGYLETVKALVRSEDTGCATLFLGPVYGSDKAALFAASDCLVLPSLNENFGNVVVEGMQFGLPVVISDNVYIADEVAEAGAGIICGYDVGSLVLALRAVAMDRDARKQMSEAAKVLGETFTPENLSPRYVRTVVDILKRVGRTPPPLLEKI